MLKVSVTLDTAPAKQRLAQLGAVLSDFQPFWNDVLDPNVTEKFQQQFGTFGANGGTPWAPLRPATLEYKARYSRQDMGILRFFDVLFRAWTVPGGQGSIRVLTPASYTRGVSGGAVPYAIFHQTGWLASRWGRVQFRTPHEVPARPVLPDPVPQAWIEEWAELFQAWIKQQVAGANS